MALSAAFYISSSPVCSLILSSSTHRPFLSQTACSPKPISVKASSTSLDYSTVSVPTLTPPKTSTWKWKFQDNIINIYYEEHESESPDPPKNILIIPTISDVSTVEEWRVVARDIVQRVGKVNWRATVVDWPGLGYSNRPKIDYNADVMEKFLVDFMNAPDSPMACSVMARNICAALYCPPLFSCTGILLFLGALWKSVTQSSIINFSPQWILLLDPSTKLFNLLSHMGFWGKYQLIFDHYHGDLLDSCFDWLAERYLETPWILIHCHLKDRNAFADCLSKNENVLGYADYKGYLDVESIKRLRTLSHASIT